MSAPALKTTSFKYKIKMLRSTILLLLIVGSLTVTIAAAPLGKACYTIITM